MDDFELPKVKELISFPKLNDSSNEFWETQYLRWQSLYMYFQYSVAQVRIQEENLKLMENGGHQNFPTHKEYAESDIKIYSSALAAYAHIRTCLNFAKELSEAVENSKELEKLREDNKNWGTEVVNKRIILQAHPYQDDQLVWKRSMRNSNGNIEFPIRNIKKTIENRKIIINPRQDLERLRIYLEDLSIKLKNIYINIKN